MAKYKELNKKDKIAFYVGLFLGLVFLAFFCLFLWSVGWNLYHQEYFKAAASVSFFLTGWFWTDARKRKKKIAKLEEELLTIKTGVENPSFKEFQRQILELCKENRN